MLFVKRNYLFLIFKFRSSLKVRERPVSTHSIQSRIITKRIWIGRVAVREEEGERHPTDIRSGGVDEVHLLLDLLLGCLLL